MKFGYFCNTTNWTHKPYHQLLDETNSAIRATKYLGYAAVAGGVVGSFFLAKGIALFSLLLIHSSVVINSKICIL